MANLKEQLIAKGSCDERGACFGASATLLPHGEYGLVALGINGNTLYIRDMDIRSNAGEILYKVELKKVRNLKIRTFIFWSLLKFDYEGMTYSLTNLTWTNPVVAVLKEEAGQA